MCNFSFCGPSSENPAQNGTWRGSAVPLGPPSEHFFRKLRWKMTLFEFNSPTDMPQNKKQNNGSLVEEVWKHEGMGGIYELGRTASHMWWESPPRAHTPSTDASFTYHTVSLSPNQRSQTQSISQAVWGQAQVQECFTKQDIYYNQFFGSKHPGPGLVPPLHILNTSARL